MIAYYLIWSSIEFKYEDTIVVIKKTLTICRDFIHLCRGKWLIYWWMRILYKVHLTIILRTVQNITFRFFERVKTE